MDPKICAAGDKLFAVGSFTFWNAVGRLFLSPLAMVGLFILFRSIQLTRCLHINVRYLLFVMVVSVAIMNLGTFIEMVFVLGTQFLSNTDACRVRSYSPLTNFLLRFPVPVGGICLEFTSVTLAIERTVATFKHKSYEKKQKQWIGYIWALSNIILTILALIPSIVPERPLPMMLQEFLDSKRFIIASMFLTVLNFVTILIYFLLYGINLHRSKRREINLSTKYQTVENMSTTIVMVPVMLVVLLMNLSNMVNCYFFLPKIDETTVVTDQLLQKILVFCDHAAYQLAIDSAIGLILAFLFPAFCNNIRRSMSKVLGCRMWIVNEVSPQDPIVVRNQYFKELNVQWKSLMP